VNKIQKIIAIVYCALLVLSLIIVPAADRYGYYFVWDIAFISIGRILVQAFVLTLVAGALIITFKTK